MNKKGSRSLIVLLTLVLALSSFALGTMASDKGVNSSSNIETSPQSFVLAFKSEDLPSNYKAMVENAGGNVSYEVPQIGVIEVTTNNPTPFIKAILNNRNVLSLTPSIEVRLNMPELEVDLAEADTSIAPVPVGESIWEAGWQWDIEKVTNNGASHELHQATGDVVVAVIDTGFDFNHPDLQDVVDEAGSRTFVPGTTDSWDAHSHGTHVAGTIGANGRVKGIAPGVTLRSYRVFDTGSAQQIWITDAIIAAANDGVDVINMSLGGNRVAGQWWYTDPDTGERIRLGGDAADIVAYQRAIQYAVKRNVTVVAAAGNFAQDMSNPAKVTQWFNEYLQSTGRTMYAVQGATFFAPAQLSGVVTVSATGGGFGTEDRLAFFSNYGHGAINLGAPGGDLGPTYNPADPSTRTPDAHKYLILSTIPTYLPQSQVALDAFGEEGYGWKGGTSMASPQVAGAAAAYISSVYEMTGKKPSPKQVQTHLQQTAIKTGKNGRSPYYGHGIVNVYNAIMNSNK